MIGFSLTEEQQQLQKTAHDFAVNEIVPVAAKYDEEEEFPYEILRKAWEIGLLNTEIPAEYGGLNLGVLDTILVLEQINYGCSGIGTAVAVQSLGCYPVILAGNEEQKKEYFGRVVNDGAFTAYALTEPAAGSDAAGIQTTYVDDGDHYVLNGTKIFITNGSIANWMVVFATKDRSARHGGISAFIVDADTPGLSAIKMRGKLGQRASDTAEIVLENVRVPKKNLLGGEGEGFKLAMRTFERTRPEIVACCIGIGQRCIDECKTYAMERKAFGEPIANFQAVQFMLADMVIEVEAMRLLTYKAAWELDQGADSSIYSNYAKAFGADRAMQIATNAVQIFGGYGYMKEYPVEKLMRDAKLVQIYEGTSQIQRMVIARKLLKS